MSDMMNTMVAEVQSNNLKEFKHYIENGGSDIKDYASAIEYTYDIPVNIYKSDTSDKVTQLNLIQCLMRCNGRFFTEQYEWNEPCTLIQAYGHSYLIIKRYLSRSILYLPDTGRKAITRLCLLLMRTMKLMIILCIQ